MQRKLYRSRNNRVLLGVCGGFGEYFNIDPVIVRVITVLLLIPGFFPAVIAYFVLAAIIPLEGSTSDTPEGTLRENVTDMKDTTQKLSKEIRTSLGTGEPRPGASNDPPRTSNAGLYIIGIVIIAIGVFFLLTNIFNWLRGFLVPSLLIIAGIIIVVLVLRRR